MIEVLIYALLASSPAVSALAGDRIYPLVLPQELPTPSLTYQRIGGVRPLTMSAPGGVQEARLQLDVWARTYSEAKALAEAVIASQHGRQAQQGGIRLDMFELLNDEDDFESETGLFRVSLDFMAHYVIEE